MKTVFLFCILVWSGSAFGSPFLLPSQEESGLYNVRICRDRQVLSGIKTAADRILKTKAGCSRHAWSRTTPDDIFGSRLHWRQGLRAGLLFDDYRSERHKGKNTLCYRAQRQR